MKDSQRTSELIGRMRIPQPTYTVCALSLYRFCEKVGVHVQRLTDHTLRHSDPRKNANSTEGNSDKSSGFCERFWEYKFSGNRIKKSSHLSMGNQRLYADLLNNWATLKGYILDLQLLQGLPLTVTVLGQRRSVTVSVCHSIPWSSVWGDPFLDQNTLWIRRIEHWK